jgi:hypothetical protein
VEKAAPSAPAAKSIRTTVEPVAPAATASAVPVSVGTSVRGGGSPHIHNRSSSVSKGRPSTSRSRKQGVVPAAYGQRIGRPASSPIPMRPPVGAESSVLHGSVLQGTVTVDPQPGEIASETVLPSEYAGEMWEGGEMMDGCGGCGNCDQCCVYCPRIPFDNLTIFGGVQGFTGPINRGQTGSFGFHEGFNWGAPFPCTNDCLSMQVGARFTQANFSAAEFTPDNRSQMFLTAGLFRRVDCGLQAGVVFDYLSDDWYTSVDLYQLRGELAWVFPCHHELGFWMTAGSGEDTAPSRVFTSPAVSTTFNETWESTDLYAFFYRHQFGQWEGTNARAYAGFSGEGDGLIGADFHIPVGGDFALEGGFAYLIPEEDKGPFGAGNEEESWNVFITLVWYPCSGRAMTRSYHAPLLYTADNGSFMVDRVP